MTLVLIVLLLVFFGQSLVELAGALLIFAGYALMVLVSISVFILLLSAF